MRAPLKTFLLASALFVLNLWIVKELLRAEFVDHMLSAEGGFIGLARYILGNWGDLTWFPLWFGGIPYQNTYPPLMHLTVAGAARLFGLTPGLAYHATSAVFYSLGPVTLFLFAAVLSNSRAYSFVAAALYSVTSPSLLLIANVRSDAGSVWHARRLQDMVHYGEGPHIASMTLIPLALLFLVLALKTRRPVWWFLTALGMAATALTNWIGAFALAIAVPCCVVAIEKRTRLRRWMMLAGAGVYAYLLACSWLPPSTILNTRNMEGLLVGSLSPDYVRLLWAAGLALALAGLLALFERSKLPEALQFALLYSVPMACLTLAPEWFGVDLLSQGRRFHLELETGMVLAAAFGAKLLLDRLPLRARIAIACVLLAAAVYPTVRYRRYAKRLDRPFDVRGRIEYREARWFAEHMNGRRVLPPGSVGYFLNAFVDVPQMSGGFEQGGINLMIPYFRHQIWSGENAGKREGEIAVLALRAFGVDAVAVSGPASQEVYKPFWNPKKFEGLLPEAWRDGDDVIYTVPRRSPSLAHVIRTGDLPPRRLWHGLDAGPLRPYVRALEDPALPLAAMRWLNRHTARISARLARDQILSVQISYHPGWHAAVNGAPRRVYGDRIGQLVIEPACEGPCTVELMYDGGVETRIVRVVAWGALLGGIAGVFILKRRSILC